MGGARGGGGERKGGVLSPRPGYRLTPALHLVPDAVFNVRLERLPNILCHMSLILSLIPRRPLPLIIPWVLCRVEAVEASYREDLLRESVHGPLQFKCEALLIPFGKGPLRAKVRLSDSVPEAIRPAYEFVRVRERRVKTRHADFGCPSLDLEAGKSHRESTEFLEVPEVLSNAPSARARSPPDHGPFCFPLRFVRDLS